jgi:hypothetical protein
MAKLTEFFKADQQYDLGTVVVFGGDAEITSSSDWEQSSVAGVVLGGNQSKTEVVIMGVTDCQVVGVVNPGDLLVTTDRPGVAAVIPSIPDFDGGTASNTVGTIVGKAIESFNDVDPGTIKVLVSLE